MVLWFFARIIMEEGIPCNPNAPGPYLPHCIYPLRYRGRKNFGERIREEKQKVSILGFRNCKIETHLVWAFDHPSISCECSLFDGPYFDWLKCLSFVSMDGSIYSCPHSCAVILILNCICRSIAHSCLSPFWFPLSYTYEPYLLKPFCNPTPLSPQTPKKIQSYWHTYLMFLPLMGVTIMPLLILFAINGLIWFNPTTF